MQYKNQYIRYCLEGPHSVFKQLPQKDKDILVNSHIHASYRKGEMIIKEGDKPHGLICLVSGKVMLIKDGVGGREQVLRLIRPQGLIGFGALFGEGSYHASAIAIEDSSVCIFDKLSMIRIIRRNPETAFKFLRMLSDDLVYSNDRTVSLTQKHIRGRLAESLLVVKDTYGYEQDGKTLAVCLSRVDIANLSNMTTSNAIRTLSNLASEDVIAIEGKKIMILDKNRLERISELG